MSVHNAEVRAKVLGLPESGNKRIVLIERNEDCAKDWLRQARAISGRYIHYGMHTRAIRVEGILAVVSVVVAWRGDGLRGER
jgi:hypothetical protein